MDKVKIYLCRKRIDTLATEKFHHPFQELLRACKVHKIILLGGSRINFVPISPALIGNIYCSEEDLPLKAPYQDKTCICCTQIFWEFFDEDVQASFQTERRCPCVSNHEPRFEARVSRARFARGPRRSCCNNQELVIACDPRGALRNESSSSVPLANERALAASRFRRHQLRKLMQPLTFLPSIF